MFKLQLDATGTIWFFEFASNLEAKAEENLKNNLSNLILDFQSKYSRFDPNSNISLLNRGEVLINPDEDFVKVINFGLEMEKQTNGYFTIFIGQKLEYEGYNSEYDFKSGQKFEQELIRGFEKFDTNFIKLKKSSKIDIGAYGKGLLVDRCFDYIVSKYPNLAFFINAGGDIRVNNYPQKFYLESPFEQNEYLGEIEIKNGAIASSSNLRRSWINGNNQKFAHVDSKNDVVAVFTQAKTCLLADTLSTVIFVSEEKMAEKLAKDNNVRWLKVYSSKKYNQHQDYDGHLW